MKALGTGAVIAAGGFALLLTATPVTLDLAKGGLAIKSADARVFKGGSNQRPPGGVVNPADPGGGKPVVQVPNTRGGSGGGSSGGGGKSK